MYPNKKVYTFDDVRKATYGEEKIEYARLGELSEVNMSAIYTRLIQEAGRVCKRWASDILIDIDSVRQYMREADEAFTNNDEIIEKSFLFGFRKDGVDHAAYVFARYEENRFNNEYWSLWRLDFNPDFSGFGRDIMIHLYEAEI